MITEIRDFLQIFSVRKTTTQFFENQQKINKKTEFRACFGLLKANYRLFLRLFRFHCFFLTLRTVFICIRPYIHICLYYFLILHFYFHLLFLNLLATKHIFFSNWDSLQAEQPLQGMESQEKEAYRKSD